MTPKKLVIIFLAFLSLCSFACGKFTAEGGLYFKSQLLKTLNKNNNSTLFSIGGAVSGLSGTGLILQNNGSDDLIISSNGSFVFSTKVDSGAIYNITVLTQPVSPLQVCSVSGGSGTVVNNHISSITINCSTNSYTVGGTISGLAGTGLTLLNNGGDSLNISANGSFAFATPLFDLDSFNVTISAQPTSPWQTCSVTGGVGAIAGSNETGISINCSTNNYSIGVTVSGLSGSGLVLQNNSVDDLAITANGSASFSTPIASGDFYSVTVLTQPTSPSQNCIVSGGSGTVAGGNVTGIAINCSTNSYTIGGNISGLAGTGLVLQNNGGDNLSIGANGAYSFSTPIVSSSNYNVTVLTQPTSPWQSCSVNNGSGTVASSNIVNVDIICTTNNYTIGGTVSGLFGTGLVLQNNGGDDKTIIGNGSFSFDTAIASGDTYNVTILTQPSSPTQTCTVSGATGTVAGGNVTAITINCSTNSYSIGGSVSGLTGSGLVLQNNGGDDVSIGANGSYSFSTTIASGNSYNVTVLTDPTSPWQSCSVTNGSGTVDSTNITNVDISCTTNSYIIGGTVNGLSGSGLILQNNGGDDKSIIANGAFSFSAGIDSGNSYSVTVLTQPSSPTQTCSVFNGAGTVTNVDIFSIVIDCSNPEVISTTPQDGAAGIDKASNITVTFNKIMNTATIVANTTDSTCTGTIQISNDNFTSCEQWQAVPVASNSDKSFTLTPAGNLQNNTTYKIRVTTAAQDTAGTPISAIYTTPNGFTVSNTVDSTPPQIASTNPSDNDSDVATNTSIQITFNESIDSFTLTTNTADTSCSGTIQISADNFATCLQMAAAPEIAGNSKTVTITPLNTLTGSTTHKIRVTTGVQDLAGNPLSSTYTTLNGFTTGLGDDVTQPTVDSTTPGDGVTGVAVTTLIVVTFSEPMKNSSISSNSSSTNCSGSIQVSADNFATCVRMQNPPSDIGGNSFELTPDGDLAFGATYQIRVTTVATDSAGNPLAATFTQLTGFTTAP